MRAARALPLKPLGAALSLALILSLGFALGESMGWPILILPLQHQLEQRSGRTVRLQAVADASTPAARLHFGGDIRLQAPFLELGAPAWSQTPYLVSAQDVDVRLRYGDVWRAWQGGQLVVQALAAHQFTAYLEHLADGRATWQLRPRQAAVAAPQVQSAAVDSGQLHYNDALLDLQWDAELNLSEAEPTLSALPTPQGRVLYGRASGHYRQDAFRLTLRSTGALPWDTPALPQGVPLAVKLSASVGLSRLDFDGTAQDALHLDGLDGAIRVQGPSLAAIGRLLGVTLPTTPAFRLRGQLRRQGAVWRLAAEQAQIGQSQLHGSFVFDRGTQPARLTGTLGGGLLKLADLAPAVGKPLDAARPPQTSKVLPTRLFDLASLRAMDADVLIHIQQLDTHSTWLEPLRPFAAHLQLTAGLLTLTDIDARTAQGHLAGTLALDGQHNTAHWVAALNWDAVQLQDWIHQTRAPPLPPYVTGQLQGHATLQGSGRSTAEILGSLQGEVRASVEHGTLSHLLMEMGGLDVAESLGVLLSGDRALTLDCALADLVVDHGTLHPRLLVLDTSDSTVWLTGSISLATEQLDLRAVVAPKDFSLLALRSPLHIGGSFAHPSVAIAQSPLGLKLGSSLLLGLLHPLAAALPLVDPGQAQAAQDAAAQCQARLHQKLTNALPSLRRQP